MTTKTTCQLLALGGAALLISSCGTSRWDIYAPGENMTSLTKITDGEDICENPFGGDNGKDLFFTVCDKHGISRNIYKKDDPNSASISQKTAGKNDNRHPTFCAATNQVAFSGRQEGAFSSDIYMVNATQSNALSQVTNTPDATEYFPCLSKDGKRVVYQRFSAYSNNLKDCEIWIRNLQSGENIMLSHGRMPSFSPDGRTIVHMRYTADGTSTCIWIMNDDGSNSIQLTDAKLGIAEMPRFSPDGKQIVFACHKREKKDYDLYVIDRNGNNLTQLTINKSYDGEPYWANDGNIYFTSDRGGRRNHYQIWRFKYGNSHYTPEPNPQPQPQPKPDPIYTTTHTVKQGETISQVASQYGVTVKDLVKWNNLSTMTLKPGQRLKVSAQ